MAQHVLARTAEHLFKPALICLAPDGGIASQWSYADLADAVLGTAAQISAAGCHPGDRVLLRVGNDAAFPIAFLGAIAGGFVPVATSAQLTRSEITKMSEQVSPRLIIQDPDLPAPDAKTIPVLVSHTVGDTKDERATGWHVGDPNRPGYIVFTSGTSGAPRAVEHAHRAIWARGMMHDGWYGLRSSDRLMHAGAFNWTFTLGTGLMDPWTLGATAIVPAPGTAPEDLPAMIERHEATLFAAAPGVFRKVLRSNIPPLPHLRHGLSAGEKLHESIRTAWGEATGTEIYEAFGMSECSTFLSATPGVQAAKGTLGRPQPGRCVALLDDNGSPTETGEIAIHKSDPGLFLGYVGQLEDTAARFRGDWFLTGDLGATDASGDIAYAGRADDMMNAGGFRVSPLEVERAFAEMPGVDEVGAAEIEVKPGTRIIALFYSAEAPVPKSAFEALASRDLAAYKTPKAYQHIDALPKSPNGKLQRKRLAALFERST